MSRGVPAADAWLTPSGRLAHYPPAAARYEMSLQAVYKHLRVLEDAGVVSRPPGPQPRPVHLQAEVFDLMDSWIERYRRNAEQRYRRLDAVLEAMDHDEHKEHNNERDR